MKNYFLIFLLMIISTQVTISNDVLWDQRSGLRALWNELTADNFFNNSNKCIINEVGSPVDYIYDFPLGIYDYENHTYNEIEFYDAYRNFDRDHDVFSIKLSQNDSTLCIMDYNHKLGTQRLFVYDIENDVISDSLIFDEIIAKELKNAAITFDNKYLHILDKNNSCIREIDLVNMSHSSIKVDKEYEYHLSNEYYLRNTNKKVEIYDYDNNLLNDAEFDFDSIRIAKYHKEFIVFDGWKNLNDSLHKNLYFYNFHDKEIIVINNTSNYANKVITFDNNDQYLVFINAYNIEECFKFYYNSKSKEYLSTKDESLIKSDIFNNFLSESQENLLIGKGEIYFEKVYLNLWHQCFYQDRMYVNTSMILYDFNRHEYINIPNIATSEIYHLRLSGNENLVMNIAAFFFNSGYYDATIYDIYTGELVDRKVMKSVIEFAPDNKNIIVVDENKLWLSPIGSKSHNLYDEFYGNIKYLIRHDSYLEILIEDSLAIYDFYNKNILMKFHTDSVIRLNISDDKAYVLDKDTIMNTYDLKTMEKVNSKEIGLFRKAVSETGKYKFDYYKIIETETNEVVFEIPEDDILMDSYYHFIGDDYFFFKSYYNITFSGSGLAFLYDLQNGTHHYFDFLGYQYAAFVYSKQHNIFVFQDCENTNSSLKAIQPDFVSVQEDHSREKGGKIYPNPVTDHVYLSEHFLDNNIGQANICIYDLQGSLVKRFLNINTDKLNIADLPTGSYMLMIQSGNEIESEIFIKE